MEEMWKKLPQHTCTWLKNKVVLYKYGDFWAFPKYIEGALLAQQNLKAKPTDIFLCSSMKTGTTWLKALAFAIVTRENCGESTHPLFNSSPHECVPMLETRLEIVLQNQINSKFHLIATHLPYHFLPETVITSNCKLVYIYRNIKDVIVSYYNFRREALEITKEEAPFEEAFREFYNGISAYGPYWDHILGYWKANRERPDRILLIKYEDLLINPKPNVMMLGNFLGKPFSKEEENDGVVDKLIDLCSFDSLRNLDVNKYGKSRPSSLDNRLYFRKAEIGDWKNYFTKEMEEEIDKLMDEKLSGTDLVLK